MPKDHKQCQQSRHRPLPLRGQSNQAGVQQYLWQSCFLDLSAAFHPAERSEKAMQRLQAVRDQQAQPDPLQPDLQFAQEAVGLVIVFRFHLPLLTTFPDYGQTVGFSLR